MSPLRIGDLVVWESRTDRGTNVNFKKEGAPADAAATLTVNEVAELRRDLAEFLPPWAREPEGDA